jgi:hypothetical protein
MKLKSGPPLNVILIWSPAAVPSTISVWADRDTLIKRRPSNGSTAAATGCFRVA